MITHHEALIYTMVLVSAADREMPDVELESMTDMVAHLPVFRDFKTRRVGKIGAACAKLLEDENGLDKAFGSSARACQGSCAKPPMRWPATWPLPTAR